MAGWKKRYVSALSALPGRGPSSTDASRVEPERPQQNLRKAVLLMMVAVTVFGMLDSSAKLAGQHLPTLQVVWLRFAIHFAVAAIFFNPWRTPQAWRTKRPVMQTVRSATQIICTALNFMALGYLQIAQTLSIQFTTPVFVTILSIFVLKEKVGLYRWGGIAIGLLGVMIVTQPGMSGFHWAFLLSIISVIIGSGYNILTRSLAATENAASMLLFMSAMPMVLLLPVVPFFWQWPDANWVWWPMFGAGFFGALGHYLMICAHRYAPASYLAPIQYFEFVAVLIIGFYVFGDVPTIFTFIGGGIVIFSGLFIWWREKVVNRRLVAKAAAEDAKG